MRVAPQRGGKTPAHVACENGHDDVLVALVAHGADVNLANVGLLTRGGRRVVPFCVRPAEYVLSLGSF